MGCEYLKIKKNGLKVDKSQAVASIGQIELMNFYKKIFDKNKITTVATDGHKLVKHEEKTKDKTNKII